MSRLFAPGLSAPDLSAPDLSALRPTAPGVSAMIRALGRVPSAPFHAMHRVLAPILATALVALCPTPTRAGVFDLDTIRVDRGDVLVDADAPLLIRGSLMHAKVAGKRLDLLVHGMNDLRDSVIREARVPVPAHAKRVALIRLRPASRVGYVEILQLQDGKTFAREFDPATIDPTSTDPAAPAKLAAKLRPDGWNEIARQSARYAKRVPTQETFEPPLSTIEVGTVWPAPWIIDGDEIDRRFTGKQADRAPASRDLSQERFAIHVGPGISPRTPAALLVWLSPMANATIPKPLADAASRQGIIIIAPTDVGPSRDLTNRIQLALDAAYAAQERWHIDPNRVYIGGFSAGAGLANLIAMGFSDVFKGTLLVGSASFYQEVQAGPKSFWPRQFNEPSASNMKRLAGTRSALLVGESDPARPHVVAVAKRMALENIRAESFVVPSVGHEIPSEEYFVKAFQWIEADAASEWEARCEKGVELLDDVAKARNGGERQKALMIVLNQAPWTPAAWRAMELFDQEISKDASRPAGAK